MLVRQSAFDVVLLDLGLPEGNGLELLEALPPGVKAPPTIVMTGDTALEQAVGALRMGVVDYLLKPFSLDALDATIARILSTASRGTWRPRTTTRRDLQAAAAWRDRYAPQLLGESDALLAAVDVLRRVAHTDCPVLIHGETGTGKELMTRAVHAASGRGGGPLVAVNCAAIPDQLLESELFGHAKGAYTGAAKERPGRFLCADGGTLMLDEIGELPLAVQGKLLRALQEGEITPLGDDKPVHVDVRVVAATHRTLEEMVEQRKFREDLLYRLDVIRVEIPALRDRAIDIPLLVEHFIEDANRRRGCAVRGVQGSALELLQAYEWPGNVRQMANVVERMVILRGEGVLEVQDVPQRVRLGDRPLAKQQTGSVLPAQGIDLRAMLEDLETSMLRQALARTRGNKNRAAALLRLNRTTLVEKLKKRGLGQSDEHDEVEDFLEAAG
jgi:DNA-binding NtrC family response regulator